MAMARFTVSPWPELDQWFRLLSQAGAVGSNGHPWSAGFWSPAVSVEESGDALYLTAELPGLTAHDVEVRLENDVLTIRGEKREDRGEAGEPLRQHLRERRYGRFQRAFTVPRTIRADGITARLENGVLRVTLPKAPEARSRIIPIVDGAPPELPSGDGDGAQ